jgi:regulatory protein
MGRPRARLSLKGRALQLLAQRDQSRLELRGKLLRHAAAEARARAAAAAEAGDERAGGDASDDDGDRRREEVDALLDWLEANRYLSAERFAESRVHAREARFGNRRIRAELAQHGVALTPEAAAALAASELQRAAAVRARRFSALPQDAAERAAQARFLAGRGFSPEVIQRVLRALTGPL